MSKVRLNHIDWDNYDELDGIYDESMEMIHNKKRKNGKFKDVLSKITIDPVGDGINYLKFNQIKKD